MMSPFHRAILNGIVQYIRKNRLGGCIPDDSVPGGFQQGSPRKQ
jgi:hypothetical protein